MKIAKKSYERKVNQKNRYKVLEARMINHTGIFWKLWLEEMAEYQEHFPRIAPVFNRDGWYLDRATGFIWNEQNGIAWTDDGDKTMFPYILANENTRRLSPRERVAIRELIKLKICPRELKEHLYRDEQLNELDSLGRGDCYDASHDMYRKVEKACQRR